MDRWYYESGCQTDTYHCKIDTHASHRKPPRDRERSIPIIPQESNHHRVLRFHNQSENTNSLSGTRCLPSGYPYEHIPVCANQHKSTHNNNQSCNQLRITAGILLNPTGCNLKVRFDLSYSQMMALSIWFFRIAS